MSKPIIIGVTGSIGAGCTTVGSYLEQAFQFRQISLSHIVEEEMAGPTKGPGTETAAQRRERLQDAGDELRAKNGKEYLAVRCIEKIQDEMKGNETPDFVLDAIRNPWEVQALRAVFPNFYLVAVHAPRTIRWERVKEKFNKNEGEFEDRDERDRGEGQPDYGQQVQQCVDQADVFISNHRQCKAPLDWSPFHEKIAEHVKLMYEPGSKEPDPDEVYMGQAYASSLLSTCCKRKAGAVIVRTDKQSYGEDHPQFYLISTGWNEVPPGVQSCRELGGNGYCVKDQGIIKSLKLMSYCPGCGSAVDTATIVSTAHACPTCRKKAKYFVPGRQLDLCPAVHAEEAAILQASILGSTSLPGTTLYTTTFPCLLCAKKIMSAGIKEIVFTEPYPMPESLDLLSGAGSVALRQFEGVSARAYFRLYQ